jgi:hypothetical protein
MNERTGSSSAVARYRALTRPDRQRCVDVLDQRLLPHAERTLRIATAEDAATAIRDMVVRGAPLIGAVGAYGMALGLDADASDPALARLFAMLDATRPTAVNLRWALERVRTCVASVAVAERADAAWRAALPPLAADRPGIARRPWPCRTRRTRRSAARRARPCCGWPRPPPGRSWPPPIAPRPAAWSGRACAACVAPSTRCGPRSSWTRA